MIIVYDDFQGIGDLQGRPLVTGQSWDARLDDSYGGLITPKVNNGVANPALGDPFGNTLYLNPIKNTDGGYFIIGEGIWRVVVEFDKIDFNGSRWNLESLRISINEWIDGVPFGVSLDLFNNQIEPIANNSAPMTASVAGLIKQDGNKLEFLFDSTGDNETAKATLNGNDVLFFPDVSDRGFPEISIQSYCAVNIRKFYVESVPRPKKFFWENFVLAEEV